MKKMYLSILILMLVIGFAAVATNLVINGTINFGFNENDFDSNVIFTYTNTMYGDAEIINEGKSITFNTTKLEDVNQQSILKFDVTNKSLQYDASVTINCGLEEESQLYKDYIKIEQDLSNPFELNSGQTKTGTLTITLTKAYDQLEEKDINMACKLEATPEERTSEGTYTPVEPQYEEILLHGADPVLEATPVEGISLAAETNEKKLIPVTISEKDGIVTRADTTKEWYDYETKKWANAVILVDGAKDPGADKQIPENQIESYFVWIPKYRYKLWNVGTLDPTHDGPFAIEIEFGTENTTNVDGKSCTVPLNNTSTQALSGENGECDNGEWMTHPAFITMGVNGFWVGKFEVGYKQNNDLSTISSWVKGNAEIDEESSEKVIVKPNVYTWRFISTSKIFYSLKNYANNLDSHMMKNTEWGAVVYLSHSKYGINNEIAQNNNSDYITGYAKTVDSMYAYPNSNSFNASTTGNITGIYDMSGGAWERMAAYMDIGNDDDQIVRSGFTKQEIKNIGEKYFDVYDKNSTDTSYDKRILGDATGELGPFNNKKGSWYEDQSVFVRPTDPWFGRGGHYFDSTSVVGQFYFNLHHGGTGINDSSRLVLAPKEG